MHNVIKQQSYLWRSILPYIEYNHCNINITVLCHKSYFCSHFISLFVLTTFFSLYLGLENLMKGEKMSVRIIGNPSPFAIGKSLKSWQDIVLGGKICVRTCESVCVCLFKCVCVVCVCMCVYSTEQMCTKANLFYIDTCYYLNFVSSHNHHYFQMILYTLSILMFYIIGRKGKALGVIHLYGDYLCPLKGNQLRYF